jgi:hypothetical protein
MQPRSLLKETADTKDLHEELDLRIKGTWINIEMTRTLAENSMNSKHSQQKLTPKLNGPSSWTMFLQQFKLMLQQDPWMPCEKATHLSATYNEPDLHIFGVSTTTMYKEILRCLRIATVTIIWMQNSTCS